MTRNGRKRCLTRLAIRAALTAFDSKPSYGHLDRGDFDLDFYQIVMEYLRAIGIDIEVEKIPVAQWGSYVRDSRGEGLFLNVHNTDYITGLDSFYSTGYNPSNVNDPAFDAIMDAFRAATATEEQQRLATGGSYTHSGAALDHSGTESAKFHGHPAVAGGLQR